MYPLYHSDLLSYLASLSYLSFILCHSTRALSTVGAKKCLLDGQVMLREGQLCAKKDCSNGSQVTQQILIECILCAQAPP